MSKSKYKTKGSASKYDSCIVTSSSVSSSEDELPDLSYIRSSRDVQKRIDSRVAQLQKESHIEGKESKTTLKRGGNVQEVVQKQVAWPHECILGWGHQAEGEF